RFGLVTLHGPGGHRIEVRAAVVLGRVAAVVGRGARITHRKSEDDFRDLLQPKDRGESDFIRHHPVPVVPLPRLFGVRRHTLDAPLRVVEELVDVQGVGVNLTLLDLVVEFLADDVQDRVRDWEGQRRTERQLAGRLDRRPPAVLEPVGVLHGLFGPRDLRPLQFRVVRVRLVTARLGGVGTGDDPVLPVVLVLRFGLDGLEYREEVVGVRRDVETTAAGEAGAGGDVRVRQALDPDDDEELPDVLPRPGLVVNGPPVRDEHLVTEFEDRVRREVLGHYWGPIGTTGMAFSWR